MTRGSQKYYLRPNGLVDNRYAENLLKKKQVIKVNDAYFNNIEVIKKDTKKKIIQRKNLSVENFINESRNNEDLQKLFDSLQMLSKNYNNKLFKNKRFLIFGILNITPDSFSDGGDYFSLENSVKRAKQMFDEGADFIDIGGESTRPGADQVDVNNEILRVMPAIQRITNLKIPISLDTRNSSTMEFGLSSGVSIINDVSGLKHDLKSVKVISKFQKPIIIMHMPGTPKNMMKKNKYNDVVLDVYDFLENRVSLCEEYGINKSNIILDPGIGFGKDFEQNLSILKNLSIFHAIGCPIMVGISRKRFISNISKEEVPKKRLGGTVSASLIAMNQGVNIHRVHDVSDIVQSIKVFQQIIN